MNSFWKIWARALGEKGSDCDKESDRIAFVRTLLVLQAVICNAFIVANILYNWYK